MTAKRLCAFRLSFEAVGIVRTYAVDGKNQTEIVEEALRLYHGVRIAPAIHGNAKREPAIQQNSSSDCITEANCRVPEGQKHDVRMVSL